MATNKNKFYYLGVSSNTINNDLMDFMKTEQGKRIEYKFLLMNPGKEEIIGKQEAYKNGYKDKASLNSAKKDKLSKDVKITKNNILVSVDKIRNTGCEVEIKYFEEFLPWWMYIFDDKRIYIGLLEFGKDGRESPLAILEKNENYFTLYNAFENNWKRIWENATEVK